MNKFLLSVLLIALSGCDLSNEKAIADYKACKDAGMDAFRSSLTGSIVCSPPRIYRK